jgi:hypothetical protein
MFWKGCPSGYYGQDCDYHCAGDDDYCRGLLICLADPYGCSCYSGWYGTNCDIGKNVFDFIWFDEIFLLKVCPSDRYGPDCSYQCSCPTCNRFTGVCNCVGTECYQGIISFSLRKKYFKSNISSLKREFVKVMLSELELRRLEISSWLTSDPKFAEKAHKSMFSKHKYSFWEWYFRVVSTFLLFWE